MLSEDDSDTLLKLLDFVSFSEKRATRRRNDAY